LFYHHHYQQQQLAGFHGCTCSILINKFFGQPVTVSDFPFRSGIEEIRRRPHLLVINLVVEKMRNFTTSK
jgi:hypothetical protein